MNLQFTRLIRLVFLAVTALFLTTMAQAQQNVLKYISNPYVTSANALNSLAAIKNYRNQIECPPIITDEISNADTYYKISYKPATSSSSSPGVLNISYRQLTETTSDFEKGFNVFFNGMMADTDPTEFINEVVKLSGVNGGYFFQKSDMFIYFYIESNSKKGSLSGIIEIYNLTDAQMKAFAKDFVQKMKFK